MKKGEEGKGEDVSGVIIVGATGEEKTEMSEENQKIVEIFGKLESGKIVIEQAIDMAIDIDSREEMVNLAGVIKDIVNFQLKQVAENRQKHKRQEAERYVENWAGDMLVIYRFALAQKNLSNISKKWLAGQEIGAAEAQVKKLEPAVDRVIKDRVDEICSRAQFNLGEKEVKEVVIGAVSGIMFRMAETEGIEGGEK